MYTYSIQQKRANHSNLLVEAKMGVVTFSPHPQTKGEVQKEYKACIEITRTFLSPL